MSLNARLAQTAHRIWRHKGWVSTLLLPLAWLSAAFVRRKTAQYQAHPERVFHSHLPVVVVGNIYVGGTGKTPVVMALVQALQQRGWHPGVISRGYGVAATDHALVGSGQLNPLQFGDEPTLISRATLAPVAVHPRRVLALQALQQAYPAVDVVIADDGLQHLALGRDLEIVVQDGRGTGNGRLLPAGPLREPAEKLRHVDFLISNLQADETVTLPATTTPPHLIMRLQAVRAVNVVSGQVMAWADWLVDHRQDNISAVAAIGQPERFFAMLRAQGLFLADAVALPDHYAYTSSPFPALNSTIVLITAKDAVKCADFADPRLWAVHVEPVFSDNTWLESVHQRLVAIAAAKADIASPLR
ncbi:MAG: tetraacyldisaccharide 4'-kinase [Burkholderiaceae bacterium]|nr:tetraacyldisaccharide 4'-kinase [Burkholderiaceae bacterium]